MTTPVLLELFAGFLTAGMALWFVVLGRSALPLASRSGTGTDGPPAAETPGRPAVGAASGAAARIRRALGGYFLSGGVAATAGLLLLRLSIGALMIHHGQEKLADPRQFADTYVASLHLPFPLFFAYVAGFSELIGSWLLILGLLTPLGALAIAGTMTVAACQHILTAGFNLYVLELVGLYLGGSLALLLLGPGRLSFDAAIVADLIAAPAAEDPQDSPSAPLAQEYGAVAGGGRL